MATATYSPTVNADVVNIWRTVQTSVHKGFQFMSEEWEQLDFLKRFKVDMSLRTITVPLDITEDFGIASIAEGAFEARPSSPNVEELVLTYGCIVRMKASGVWPDDARFSKAELKRFIKRYQHPRSLNAAGFVRRLSNPQTDLLLARQDDATLLIDGHSLACTWTTS